MRHRKRRSAILFLFLLRVATALPTESASPQVAGVQSEAGGGTSFTADDIVRRLEERNRERTAALREFEGTRIYRMHYQGFFGSRDAEMVVGVKSSPDQKQFAIESQSGSKFIIDHVFKKLLEGEKEATAEENRQRAALSASNYVFTLASSDAPSEHPAYVFDVVPKTDGKYLYRGKIWVDAKDFAVIRIEAEPAKNPSVWIKKTVINHTYEKVDEFWLPAENRTDSSIRFGGHALLLIEYKDYRITQTKSLDPGSSAASEPAPRDR
jgi:hypothetical protein